MWWLLFIQCFKARPEYLYQDELFTDWDSPVQHSYNWSRGRDIVSSLPTKTGIELFLGLLVATVILDMICSILLQSNKVHYIFSLAQLSKQFHRLSKVAHAYTYSMNKVSPVRFLWTDSFFPQKLRVEKLQQKIPGIFYKANFW